MGNITVSTLNLWGCVVVLKHSPQTLSHSSNQEMGLCPVPKSGFGECLTNSMWWKGCRAVWGTRPEEPVCFHCLPLGTLTLGTQLPCCKEAQDTWRGHPKVFWPTAPSEVPANRQSQPPAVCTRKTWMAPASATI